MELTYLFRNLFSICGSLNSTKFPGFHWRWQRGATASKKEKKDSCPFLMLWMWISISWFPYCCRLVLQEKFSAGLRVVSLSVFSSAKCESQFTAPPIWSNSNLQIKQVSQTHIYQSLNLPHLWIQQSFLVPIDVGNVGPLRVKTRIKILTVALFWFFECELAFLDCHIVGKPYLSAFQQVGDLKGTDQWSS